MMSRQDRAKQFAPFDALKGLNEAIYARIEKRTRVERIELSDDQFKAISDFISSLKKGENVEVRYYELGHYIKVEGQVAKIDLQKQLLIISNQIISFSDIYTIKYKCL